MLFVTCLESEHVFRITHPSARSCSVAQPALLVRVCVAVSITLASLTNAFILIKFSRHPIFFFFNAPSDSSSAYLISLLRFVRALSSNYIGRLRFSAAEREAIEHH